MWNDTSHLSNVNTRRKILIKKKRRQKKISNFFPPKMESRVYSSKVPNLTCNLVPHSSQNCIPNPAWVPSLLPWDRANKPNVQYLWNQIISTRSKECFTRLHLYYNFLSFSVPFCTSVQWIRTTLSGLCFVSHLSPSSKTFSKTASWI
jgi:hypothetical protein